MIPPICAVSLRRRLKSPEPSTGWSSHEKTHFLMGESLCQFPHSFLCPAAYLDFFSVAQSGSESRHLQEEERGPTWWFHLCVESVITFSPETP